MVHGGLPLDKTVTLQELAGLDRHSITTVCGKQKSREAKILEGLMWSDPYRSSTDKGRFPNYKRKAGCFYGHDAVSEWLKANGLKYFVRSHECVPAGYEEIDCGDGLKLFTVFSASNYPQGRGMNKAAILRFRQNEAPQATQFETDEDDTRSLVESNQQTLAEVICAHKHVLLESFMQVQHKGGVTPQQWCEVMERVLSLQLDWQELQVALAPVDSKGIIHYNKFINQYKIHLSEGPAQGVSEEALQVLYRNHKQLMAVFRFLDKDNNGVIDTEEFMSGIAVLNDKLGPEDQIDASMELFKAMDLDSNGEISINEFCEAFRISKAS